MYESSSDKTEPAARVSELTTAHLGGRRTTSSWAEDNVKKVTKGLSKKTPSSAELTLYSVGKVGAQSNEDESVDGDQPGSLRSPGGSSKQRFHNGSSDEDERPWFYCETCGSNFRSKAALWRHSAEKHTPRERYPCPVPDCKGTFVKSKSLEKHHAVIHVQQKKFKCCYCDRGFFFPTYRDQHVQKRRTCLTCGARFCSKAKVTLHVLEAHFPVVNFGCPQCHVNFPSKMQLDSHVSKQNSCLVCNEKFCKGACSSSAEYVQKCANCTTLNASVMELDRGRH